MQLNELEKLNDLKTKGILTKEEFENAKKRILNDNLSDSIKSTTLNGKDNIIINNTINSQDNSPSVISVGKVLSWIFGIIFIIVGIINIPKICSIFLILSGLVILPIMTELCIKKFSTKLSGGLKFLLFILLLILGIGLA